MHYHKVIHINKKCINFYAIWWPFNVAFESIRRPGDIAHGSMHEALTILITTKK
jgi:hypothetical protein